MEFLNAVRAAVSHIFNESVSQGQGAASSNALRQLEEGDFSSDEVDEMQQYPQNDRVQAKL